MQDLMTLAEIPLSNTQIMNLYQFEVDISEISYTAEDLRNPGLGAKHFSYSSEQR